MRRPASRLGSPGANSQPSTRPAQARSLATWASAGPNGPVAAGEAKVPRAAGGAVADPARDVGLDLVDPHRADVPAACPDGTRPGRADGDLPAGAELLEAVEDLDVAAEADRQVVPRDRPLPAGRAHGATGSAPVAVRVSMSGKLPRLGGLGYAGW